MCQGSGISLFLLDFIDDDDDDDGNNNNNNNNNMKIIKIIIMIKILIKLNRMIIIKHFK